MTNKYFWTFEFDEEIYDDDFDTKEEAQIAADELYCEDIQSNNEDMRNGESFSEEIKLINFFYDEDTGERVILKQELSTVNYEHYHGDLQEHGT